MTAHGPEPAVLPARLRERVLAASRRARPAGRATPEAAEISPAEAFSRGCCARWTMRTGGGRSCASWTCRAWSAT